MNAAILGHSGPYTRLLLQLFAQNRECTTNSATPLSAKLTASHTRFFTFSTRADEFIALVSSP